MSIYKVEISEIKSSDNEALATLIREVLVEMGMPKVGSAYEDKSLDDMYYSYKDPKSIYFVLKEGGRILGGAGVAPLQNYEGNVCELQKMYFSPDGRGRGLGRKMLQACVDSAKRLRYDMMYLETQPYMDQARKLYESFGFEYIDNPMGDTGHYACQVWMIKKL